MPKLAYYDISQELEDDVKGYHKKDIFVCHETVSPQIPKSWADVKGISAYLDKVGYGIHGIVDNDMHLAATGRTMSAIFWHTDSSGSKGDGGINTRGVGCEFISRVMMDYSSRAKRIQAWLHMAPELNEAAKFCAAWSNLTGAPLVFSDGRTPGVTTHWLVTQTFGVQGGHTDAWPVKGPKGDLGGYFPLYQFITLAKRYKALGWKF